MALVDPHSATLMQSLLRRQGKSRYVNVPAFQVGA
jgi:hypothetical protein